MNQKSSSPVLYVCSLVMYMLFSCTSQDNSTEKKLVGKWKQTKLTINGQPSDDWTNDYEFLDGSKFKNHRLFNGGSISATGTYKVLNDTLYLYEEKKPNSVWGLHKVSFLDNENVNLSHDQVSAEFKKQ